MNNAPIYISNLISYFCLTGMITDNVLQWIYTIVFAISVIFPVVWSVIKSFKDKKISQDEYNEIKKELDDAKKKLEDEINKEANEDGIHNRND